MITLAVLAWQTIIALSILGTSLLAPKALLVVCIGWSVFTLVNLFFPPLVILQLVVIWVTYAMVVPKRGDT